MPQLMVPVCFQRTCAELLVGTVLLAMFVSAGCGGDEKLVRHTVSGKVSYQGAPVEEGVITFEDPATGFADSADLGSGGDYSIELPDGSYQVSIAPPMVEVGGGVDTPADTDYKKVDNIPKKYWVSTSSRLSAQVSKSQKEHDFDMQP